MALAIARRWAETFRADLVVVGVAGEHQQPELRGGETTWHTVEDRDELVPTALSRAHTLSRLAQKRGGDADAAFSVGLLSVADALLGVTMDDALAGLPLADEVADALLHRAGPDGAALTAVLDYEWGTGPVLVHGAADPLGECYAEALTWSLQVTSAARA